MHPPDPAPGARQLIVVTTPDWSSTSGRLQRYERADPAGSWRAVGDPVAVVVGRSGIAEPGAKREGDGKAPGGVFPLGTAFGFDTGAPTRLPYLPLRDTTECVDDTASRFYNRIVDRNDVDPDWNSSEKMRRIGEYKRGIVVDYNAERTAGKGSCIFLHHWSGPSSSTAGCTAMAEADLLTILGWLDPAAKPAIWIAGPAPALPRG